MRVTKSALFYLKVIKTARTAIETWKMNMSCISELGNPAIRQRHWEKLFKPLGMGAAKGASVKKQCSATNTCGKDGF